MILRIAKYMYMTWAELFLKSRHLRETKLLMKCTYFERLLDQKMTQQIISPSPFILQEKGLLPLGSEAELSKAREPSVGKAETQRLQDAQVSWHIGWTLFTPTLPFLTWYVFEEIHIRNNTIHTRWKNIHWHVLKVKPLLSQFLTETSAYPSDLVSKPPFTLID